MGVSQCLLLLREMSYLAATRPVEHKRQGRLVGERGGGGGIPVSPALDGDVLPCGHQASRAQEAG